METARPSQPTLSLVLPCMVAPTCQGFLSHKVSQGHGLQHVALRLAPEQRATFLSQQGSRLHQTYAVHLG